MVINYNGFFLREDGERKVRKEGGEKELNSFSIYEVK